MKALRLTEWGRPATLTDVPVPTPAGDQVLLRVLAAGLCHSDLHVMDAGPDELPFALPFTMGHETVGEVVAGGGSTPAEMIGRRYAVYAPWGCGTCGRCAAGAMNYCDRAAGAAVSGIGLGTDGGLAAYLAVDRARLVGIGALDPTLAAPLTDAGVTAWHAIKTSMAHVPPEGTVLVIGIGGLGHLALQLLRARYACSIMAVDSRDDALDLAVELGSDRVANVSSPTLKDECRRFAPEGFDLVADFVGAQGSIDLAVSVVRVGGHVSIVGSGGGELRIAKPGVLVPGISVSLPFWGGLSDFREVLEMANEGSIRPAVEVFPLEDTSLALQRLRDGKVRGRAVVVPDEPVAAPLDADQTVAPTWYPSAMA